MKKIIVFAVVFVLLFSGCSENPASEPVFEPEISESLPGNEEKSPEEVPEEPETDYVWENFIEQMAKHGYTREEIESLAGYGFTMEEITAMDWVNVVRNLSMIEYGLEPEKVEFGLGVLETEIASGNKKLVYSGGSGTENISLAENFVSAVKKNEASIVMGIMIGFTSPFYFELSFEPGGAIKHLEISEFRVFKTEFTEIYENEAFISFVNEEGKSLSLPKIELWPGEQLKYSANRDVPGASVTLDAAKKEARKIMLSANGYARFPGNEGKKLFGSYCAVLPDDYSEYADIYFENLTPKCEGIFDIAGKPYYLIYFYDGENFVGEGYYICAEKSNVAFGVSMVDGRLMPIEYFPKAKIQH